MNQTPLETEPQRILLVDDEEALVWSLSNRITKLRPSYAVEAVNDGAAALRAIHAQPCDLLVTDIRMAGMSGLDLIMAARQLLPALPVIVMTAYSNADVRSEIALRGSIEYLEKPFEFERFLHVVDEALERRRIGFSGAISVQTLPDIVQLYALSNATGVLKVRHRTAEGMIWFERGAISHASTPVTMGVDAFYQIMLWSGGEFTMQLGAIAPEHSIHAGWTELLMESCRLIDDTRRQAEPASGPMSQRGWSLADAQPPGGPSSPMTIRSDPVVVDMIFAVPSEFPEEKKMDVKQSLSKLDTIDGFIGAALVDAESGMLLGQTGGGPINLEVAGASNTEVVRAKRKAMRNLNLKDEIEDILISLSKQYHIIRPLRSKISLFFYVALDRSRANLAMARLTLAEVEKDLNL